MNNYYMSCLPLVSILIPVYNREYVIRRSIESALKQTYENIEIIVVDNASTDDTWRIIDEIAKDTSKLKVYRNKYNIGPVRNWQMCLSYAKGTYIKFLWSDDTIAPTFLEKTVFPMIENPSIGFSYSLTEIVQPTTHQSVPVYEYGESGCYETTGFVLNELYNIERVPASPGCAVFRRSTVEKYLISTIPNCINIDHSRTGAGNDLLLFLGACEEYDSFFFVNECLSSFYAEKDSISSSTEYYELLRSYNAAKCFFLLNSLKYKGEVKRYFTSLSLNEHLRLVVKDLSFEFDKAYYLRLKLKQIVRRIVK